MKTKNLSLGAFIEIEKGKKPPTLLERPTVTSLRFLQIDDLRPGAVPKYVEPFKGARATRADVVIAWDGANAGTVSTGLEGYIGSTLAVLRPISEIDGRYLSRFLEFNFKHLQSHATGATVPHIDRDVLEDLRLPDCDLPVQRRIADRLEQADRLRRTRRHALELSGDYLPAIFRKLFGDPQTESRWPVVPFGELISSGPQNGLYKPSTSYGTGTRIVRIDAYQNGGAIDLSTLKRLQVSDEEIATYGLEPGDFLINRVNSRSHLGKSTRITQMPEPMVFESNMMRFRVDETRLDPAFALHQLQTPFINRQIQKQAKDASNQSSINQDDVEGFGIMLPPLAQQQHFASLVTRHQRLRAIQQESLRQAEHLFQTLLKRAFGESGS